MGRRHQTLREARRARGLTQQQLAKLSGIEQQVISKIERGGVEDPQNRTVKALEEALRVRRGTLVFGSQMEALAS